MFAECMALQPEKDNYACLAELLISVCGKHRSEAWETGKHDYACLEELLICVCHKYHSDARRKTTMLAWQKCLSVFVASIALKCGGRRLCLFGRTAYQYLSQASL